MAQFDRSETIIHPIGRHGRLALRTVSGDVRVRSIDGEEVRVIARLSIRARSEDEADRAVAAGLLVVDRRDDELRVDAPERSEGGLISSLGSLLADGGTRVEATFEVDLPRGASLRLQGVSADLDVEGATGTQEYRTVSGDLSLRGVRGSISATSVSGDVSIVDGGRLSLEAKTTSGDVSAFAEQLEGTRVVTISGDVQLEGSLTVGADHRVETVSGDFQLASPGGLTLEAAGPAVSVHSELGHRLESRGMRRSMVVGDGATRVTFRSMSGDARVAAPTRRSGEAAPSVRPEAGAGSDGAEDGSLREADPAGPPVGEEEPRRARADGSVRAAAGDELAILRALERGEIGVDEATRLLAGSRSGG